MNKILMMLKKGWDGLQNKSNEWFDRYLFATEKRDLIDDRDFIADADNVIMEQSPRGARLLIRTAALAVLVLILWAAFAKIDEVTKGDGRVIPSSELQVIQSLDGGMVKSILVQEGQAVKKGDLLITIDSTRFESSLNEGRAQYLSLKAKAARLDAIANSKTFEMPAEVEKETPDIAAQEKILYQSKMAELDASLGVARQQLNQRTQELNEVRARREQASQGYQLTKKELDATRPLLKSGAVSDVEVLRLERDVSRYKGEMDGASAQIPRIQASIAEASRKVQEVELMFRNQARTELAETLGKLGSLTQGNLGLADRVKQSEIRSPMDGTVQQLFANTVGGVIQPGKDIIEIVPAGESLLLEAKVMPKDIAFLRVGQPALVKFSAYDFSIYGGLEAEVVNISADTVKDEKGNAFYLVRVKTKQSYLQKDGKRLPIIPGMMAEVDILTGKKTILSYLIKPVLRAKSSALTER
ncbi:MULTISPECIES: HlyD family type I secretion periplasmic adaptor subunit [Deefgea]|uniref:Membrane fusion protein (MFP) family protein n=1 Tax=Deefgea chitinilytica TaxID=570276 RepID=A0ABS2CDK9_9NEIS|nr:MULTISPECIES: HlyD family type I secretion periplasmic adaptor subunit [Deefgea]MBM5572236.1 HlyD family type I secretion periplasmic adaptor subunit [Deefgea chitinilytica]MBM9889471.1 HlyD family type I secretion periplasmic adaptor subunit [Deefgea sp. CFH1-16]